MAGDLDKATPDEFYNKYFITENITGKLTQQQPRLAEKENDEFRVSNKAMIEMTRALNMVKSGLPPPGVQIRIAASNDLDKNMPQGETGELLCRGEIAASDGFDKYYMSTAPKKFHKSWLITGD
eukprot:8544421-Heterocapsa_arctica.AAC.1